MINEASKLGIAMDLIENKIAKKMIERRTAKEEDLAIIEEELKSLYNEKNEIYAKNYEYIDKIIEERKDELKND